VRTVACSILAALWLGGCSPKQPATSALRPLRASQTGVARYELTCSYRSECKRQASRVCPNGFDIESEVDDDGTRLSRARVAPPPEGEGSRRVQDWWGTKRVFRMVVACEVAAPSKD